MPPPLFSRDDRLADFGAPIAMRACATEGCDNQFAINKWRSSEYCHACRTQRRRNRHNSSWRQRKEAQTPATFTCDKCGEEFPYRTAATRYCMPCGQQVQHERHRKG